MNNDTIALTAVMAVLLMVNLCVWQQLAKAIRRVDRDRRNDRTSLEDADGRIERRLRDIIQCVCEHNWGWFGIVEANPLSHSPYSVVCRKCGKSQRMDRKEIPPDIDEAMVKCGMLNEMAVQEKKK